MQSREVQAKNIAKKLVSFNLLITILSKSYKPNVDYVDGSYALLIGHYINEISRLKVGYDQNWTTNLVHIYLHIKTSIMILLLIKEVLLLIRGENSREMIQYTMGPKSSRLLRI